MAETQPILDCQAYQPVYELFWTLDRVAPKSTIWEINGSREKNSQVAEKYGRQPIFLSTPGDTSTVYFINGKKVKAEDVKTKLKKEEIEQITKKHNDKSGKTEIKIKTK